MSTFTDTELDAFLAHYKGKYLSPEELRSKITAETPFKFKFGAPGNATHLTPYLFIEAQWRRVLFAEAYTTNGKPTAGYRDFSTDDADIHPYLVILRHAENGAILAEGKLIVIER